MTVIHGNSWVAAKFTCVFDRQKKPPLSRHKTGAEVLRDAEGDQTMRRALSSDASVPADPTDELAGNDPRPITGADVMMHADLIDQEDLIGHL